MKTLNVKILLLLLAVCLSQVGWGQTNPTAFNLSLGNWGLTGWNSTVPAGSYPGNGATGVNNTTGVVSGASSANMVFHWFATEQTAVPTGNAGSDFACGYALASRPRVLGKNTSGFSFINTSSSQYDNCASGAAAGKFTGAAILALNTNNRNNIQVSWTGGTVSLGDGTPVPRQYKIRLQYRVGTSGSFTDVPGPIEHTSGTIGTSAVGPTTLPAACENQVSTVYLRWVYFQSVAGNGGSRPEMSVDEISVTSSSASCTPPSAPTVAPTQSFAACSSPTVASLAATGSNILWYADASGGSALATSTPLVSGNTYYASQTVSCESARSSGSTVSIGVCSVPTISALTATVTGTTSATIGADVTASATAISDRGTYYDVSSPPTTNQLSIGSGSTGAFTRNLTGLTPNTLYNFNGYATNSAGTATSAGLSFTTLHNAPTGATGTPSFTSIAASWVAPTGGGSATFTYDVQISSASDFSTITASTAGVSGLTSTFSSGLVASTPYYIRVRATNAGGSSAWSTTSSPVSLSPTSGTLASGLAAWINYWTGIATSPMAAPFLGSNVASAQVSRNGTLIGTSSATRYSASGWDLSSNYMSITITPNSGFVLNLNSENFIAALGSSGTGPSTYNIYSSVNGYASSIGTIANCANAVTSFVLPSSGYNNLASITFRIVNNSAVSCNSGTVASGGTGGFQGLTVTGSAVVGACTPPAAPTGSATQSFGSCTAPTIASLVATGTAIQWYSSPSVSGGALSSSLALTNGTTYYATQTVSCESVTFLPVTVSYAGCVIPTSTYTFVGSTGSLSSPSNWTPTRSAPTNGDILIFDGSTTPSITLDVDASQTLSQLKFINGINATLNVGTSNKTITLLGGSTGDDLIVAAGCSLTVTNGSTGTAGLTLTLASGLTGKIDGTYISNGTNSTTGLAGNRLDGADAGSVVFGSGSIYVQGANTSGNAFTNAGPQNTVVFQSGSTFRFFGGSNPFGLSSGTNSKVVFQAGSTFRHEVPSGSAAVPSLSNRTYADFVVATNYTSTNSFSNPTNFNNFTVLDGFTWSFLPSGSSAGTYNINGNLTLQGSGNMIVGNSNMSSALVLNGTNSQLSGTGNLIVQNLTNNASSNLSVNGNILSVTGTLLNSGTINIGNNGSLLQGSTAANSGGTYNISRSASNVNDWSFYSSPVSAAPVSNLGNSIYYAFDETVAQSYTSGWVGAPSTLVVGKGYLAFPNRVTFTGVANNGTIPTSVSLTGAFSTGTGWNLLGNPYPSSIRASSFLSANSAVIAGGTLYLWQNNQYLPYITAGTEQIGSGQAFFIQAQGGGSVSFNNTMRGTSNSTFFRTEGDASPYVRVRLSSGSDWQDAIVGFDANATDGYDVNYDGGLMNGNSNISFYSEAAGRKLTTQALESPISGSKIVPLYYTSTKGGSFDIKLQNYYNPNPSLSVTLKDKTTGAETDLTTTTIVSTVLAKGSDINRFDLVFRQAAVTGSSDNSINGSLNVYTSNETLNVSFANPSSSTADVYVFNTLGTEILKSNNVSTVGTKSFATSNLNKGVYIVKVGFANGKVENRKIVIE